MKKVIFFIVFAGVYSLSGAASAGFNDGAGPADQDSGSKRVKVEDNYLLHQAIINGKSLEEITSLVDSLSLEDCNAFYDSEDKYDHATPAMLAAQFNRLDVLKELYKKGVNLNLIATNAFGEDFTVLSVAFSYFNFDIAHWLFDLKDEKNKFIVDRYVRLSFHRDMDDDGCRVTLELPPFFLLISYLNQKEDFLSTTADSKSRVVFVCNPEDVGQQVLQDESVDKAYSLLLRYFQEGQERPQKMMFEDGSIVLKCAQDLKYDQKIINILKSFGCK